MKIGIAVQHRFPSEREVRTRRFAKLFDQKGMQTTVFAPNTTADPARGTVSSDPDPPEEELDYAKVCRFSWLAGTRFGRIVTAALPINLFWIYWFYLNFREEEIDAVIACGLRTGIPCLIAGKLLGIPVLIDIRENYPAFAETITPANLMESIVYDRRFVDLLERVTVRLADGVIVVADVRSQQLIEKGVESSRIIRILNVPLLSEPRTRELLETEANSTGGETIRLVYLGVIRKPRGLQMIINALPSFSNDEVEFLIAGDGPYVEELKQLAVENNVEDRVTFRGYIDSEEIPTFLTSGTIGVIPHEPNEHWSNTIPNKTFDYMCASLPVLATSTPPLEELFSNIDCGETFPADASSENIRQMVLKITDRGTKEMGEIGRRAVMGTYNWETECQELLNRLENLVGERKTH
jgi:glycosyltransferase involved in cell wall biosynthesis